MSTKKIFFYISSFSALAGFAFLTLAFKSHTPEMPDAKVEYIESEEVKAYFDRMERNRESTEISLEESREKASRWILKERDKLSNRLYYRKKVYKLLSKLILKAENFQEMNYQLSRLPKTEKQAFATLTVAKSIVTTMDEFSPLIPGNLYPILLPGAENNGKNLLISSTYSSSRISPVGSGGARPHRAVDIINIGNIDYISEAGELVRGNNHPGYIVAIADGIVKNVEFNHVYGWNITVEHDGSGLPAKLKKNYSDYESFYAHSAETVYVKEGDVVKKGDYLALVGNSGLSTGPHLHFELILRQKDGTAVKVNPYPGAKW